MKLTKKRFLLSFAVVTLLLAVVRLLFPQVAATRGDSFAQAANTPSPAPAVSAAAVVPAVSAAPSPEAKQADNAKLSFPDLSQDPSAKHPIRSVPNYRETFPDTNAVQLTAARRWGVSPVKNRADAEGRMRELVYIGASPYYHVDPLRQSIPYLVPRAAVLLHDIGQAFFDSLYVKGIPLHRLIVTSVLRTEEDVARLRHFNGNATENSCHLYGTTFDICYNRYKTVEEPDGPRRRQVGNDSLKFVLSEVLRDMRQQNRCFIKYEVKQGCYHMTVR